MVSPQVIPFLIGGRHVLPDGGATFSTTDPADGAALAHLGVANAPDIDAAVLAARSAYENGPWPRMRAAQRATFLFAIADELESRLNELSITETRDTGLPIMFTRDGHVPRAVSHFRYFAEEAQRLEGEAYPYDNAWVNYVSREPVGVVGVIAPWNAPLAVASIHIAAALACGNTCVLKPSELAPLTAHQLGCVSLDVGLPPGVLNVVHGPGVPTGRALAAHPGTDVICFTGSSSSGREVMGLAAGMLKRTSCELGGKSASLVFADCDFEKAIDGCLLSMFANNGEVCMAGSRIFVQQKLHNKFVAAFSARASNIVVGNPLDARTELGPLISDELRAGIERAVAGAVTDGAQVVCGGERPHGLRAGYYFEPTVLIDVRNDMRLAQEELFGPVAAIIPFSTDEEAVVLANDSPYGLAGYVWTADMLRAHDTARQLQAGVVAMNSSVIRDIRVPFGGIKQSGYGRTGGRYSIDLFTSLKTLCVPVRPFVLPQLGVSHK